MAFISKPLADLPKRVGRPSTFNADEANALLEIVSVPNATATDGIVYTSRAAATQPANKTRRMLLAVLPDGKAAKSRVYENATGGWEWAVYMTDEAPATETAPEKNGKKSSK